ncbi:MAG: nucleoside triphosphate pyrophosphohydrolase family protein [Muribaculaceae bacterium]|nr:nucleoside triphosphate pyrophosphohydrolase family protein [Muribaculaceae bacterium]
MTLNEYQEKSLSTAIYPNDGQISYLALAICGEAGELADKVKKILRDKNSKVDDTDRKELALELGDVLWYIANLAKVLGYDLQVIAKFNIEKIEGRVKRGTIHGSGDHR